METVEELLPLPFDTLPHDINKVIGGYLDIDSRVQFFRVLPENEDKFVKKLNSDKHNLSVKLTEIRNTLSKIEEATGNPNKQALLMIKMFNNLRKTKDTWFHEHKNFVRTIFEKLSEYTSRESPQLRHIRSKRIRNGLQRSALMCKAKFYVTFTREELGITVE